MTIQIITKVLPITSIKIPKERQRSVDDSVITHLNKLSEDIARDGLLHAISIDTEGNLITGWCRLHAIESLPASYSYGKETIPVGHIPCIQLQSNDSATLYRIELMENLRRKNLSPVDEARAVAQLHKMLSQVNSNQTEMETGVELDALRGESRNVQVAKQEVSDSILIDSLSSDPDVAKASTRKEAVNIARKKLEKDLMFALGSVAKENKSERFTLNKGDCVELLPKYADGIFQGIVVDPPYGIDADKFNEQTMTGGHAYEDSEGYALAISTVILEEGFRITKSDAHLYMFCDIRNWKALEQIARSYGWNTFASPLMWNKVSMGHAPIPGFFSKRYEAILFCYKGNRQLSKTRSDIFEFPAVRNKVHAAQKPVELIQELLSLSFFPNEFILDPCCGSGTIFAAGKELELNIVGIEREEETYILAKSLIKELEGK